MEKIAGILDMFAYSITYKKVGLITNNIYRVCQMLKTWTEDRLYHA